MGFFAKNEGAEDSATFLLPGFIQSIPFATLLNFSSGYQVGTSTPKTHQGVQRKMLNPLILLESAMGFEPAAC